MFWNFIFMCKGNFASTCVYEPLPCNGQGGQRNVYNLLRLKPRSSARTASVLHNLWAFSPAPAILTLLIGIHRSLTMELLGLSWKSGMRTAWPQEVQTQQWGDSTPLSTLLSVCPVPQTFRSLLILQAPRQQIPQIYSHNYMIRVQNNVFK